MRLQRLKLYNFRRFKGDHDCVLNTKLTVFAANNGAGKSSVLDAIALAYGPFLTRLPKVAGNALADSDICMQREKDAPFAFIGAEAQEDDECPDYPSSLDTSISWGRTKWHTKSNDRFRMAQEALGDYQIHGNGDINVFADYLIEKEESKKVSFPILAYYGTGRAVIDMPERRRGFEKDFPRFEAYADCLNPKTNFKRLFVYFYFLEDLERREKEEFKSWEHTNPQLEAIRKAIESFLPEYTNPRTALRPLRFVVDSTKDGDTYDIKSLSDGYKTSLAMVMDIAVRMVEANPYHGSDALMSPGIILIDEIELHLHPSWQQRIIPDLQRTFPNVQFICTTHSPQVLSTVPSECIRTIQDDGRITEPNCKTYGAESKRVLEELMGVSSRPPMLEQEINEFVHLTDSGDWASPRYNELQSYLLNTIGETDPLMINTEIKKQFQELELEN